MGSYRQNEDCEIVFSDQSMQNCGLYYTYNKTKAESLSIPAPLHLHLETFLSQHYRRKIEPDPIHEYEIKPEELDLKEAWYTYAKQLQAMSYTQFLQYQDLYGSMTHDKVEELS